MSRESRVVVFVHDATDAEMIEMQMRKARVHCSIQRITAKDQLLRTIRSAPPDLVIAEGAFPRLDVQNIMGKALAAAPGTPWIILAAPQTEDAVVGWMKAGAEDVVTRKSLSRLGSAASALLEKSTAAIPPAPKPSVTASSQPVLPSSPAPSHPSPAPSPGPPDAGNTLLRDLVKHAPDLMTVLDDQGVRLYSNPAHRDVLDSPERLQGTVAFVDVHPDDRQRVAETLRAGMEEGEEIRLEYRLMDNKGSVRVLESVGATFISAASGKTNAVVVSRDMTERAQREHDLQALLKALGPLSGEPFFHNLVSVIGDTLAVRYVLVSECLYQPCERVRSLAYLANGTFMPPFEYDITDTTCEAVFATGAPVHYPDSVQELFPKETALVAMDARSYLGVPLIGTGSAIVGHLFLIDDKRLADSARALSMLTQVANRTAMEVERFRKDRSGRAAEFRLRFILESLADGVLVTDSHDIVTYLNEQVVSFIGFSGVDMIGKPLMQFLAQDQDPPLETLPEDGEIRVRLRCRDGDVRGAVLQAKPLKDGAGRGLGTVFLVRPAAD